METPEIHPPHGAHTGRRWLDLTLSLSALIVSFTTVGLALHHGQIMEKLVQANSIPFLTGGVGDLAESGEAQIWLSLHNAGVGPAHEKSLRVRMNGAYVHNVNEFIAAAIPDGPNAARLRGLLKGSVVVYQYHTRFIPARESQKVFAITKTPANAEAWALLDQAKNRLEIDFCFCSVFNECWHSEGEEPTPVAQCTRDESQEFVP